MIRTLIVTLLAVLVPALALAGDRHKEAYVRKPLPTPEEIAKLPPDGGPEFNRLVHEQSPYLLQHARNPVDWYPWGDAAFEKAKAENKPVFLSIGYSTCHWCHVMEHESFESDEIAAVMNELFVCIKVDREERPDVDNVYMASVMALTGSGGWPMSVFLTHDRKPFWGGTYFPPEDRFGRPGFPTVLRRLSEFWKQDRDKVHEAAEQLTAHIQGAAAKQGVGVVNAETLELGFQQFVRTFDAELGGFGPAPKFPRSFALSYLIQYHQRTGSEPALAMVRATLDHMARGGLHDHVGGGFHRYSTDREWLLPHFEKMLYDQALLARTYLETYQVTGESHYADVARDIFRYVLRDMTDPAGGFYSAEDADSEGVEGKFYVWTRKEIVELLGEEDGALFSTVYQVSEEGNFAEEATGEVTGDNILHLDQTLEELATSLKLEPAALSTKLEGLRERLFQVREKRIHPYMDDKILTDWNGLMISALALGGRALNDDTYTSAARRAADFLLDKMRRDGRLLHRYRQGQADIVAYLDDHVFLGNGLLDLYETTFELRYLEAARDLARDMLRLFEDEKEHGFFGSGRDGEVLVARTMELYDGAIPSGNGAGMVLLLRLGRLTAEREFEKAAERCMERFALQISQGPMSYPVSLMALDFALGPTREVVLAGDPEDPGFDTLVRALHRRHLPNTVFAHSPTGADAEAARTLMPFLEGLDAVDGKATAYVCQNYACQLPTSDLDEFEELLEARPPRRSPEPDTRPDGE